MRETSMEHDALAALSAEAERRRVAMGRLRYSYGDLVADTTPEDRAAIVAQYRRERHRVGGRLVMPDDGTEMRKFREKRDLPEEPPPFVPYFRR